MSRLIWIAIAAVVSYVAGKILGHEEGYDKGLKKKIIVELRQKCPPEFRDKVMCGKVQRIGEDRMTVAYCNSKYEVLCRAEIMEQGVGNVFKKDQLFFI